MYGIKRLAVAGIVGKRQVDVEKIFPFASDNREGLNLGKVHLVEREDGEDFREAPRRVRHGEDERRLVLDRILLHLVGRPPVGDGEEAGEVPLVRLDALGQNLHAVDLGGVLATDGGVSLQLVLGNPLGAACRVFLLDHFGVRDGVEELGALHQGNRVGINFFDVCQLRPRQGYERMRDAQLVFPDDLEAALANQLVVLQEASGDGVLDCHQSENRGVALDGGDYVAKRIARERLYLVAFEILVRRDVVIRTGYSLNGYFPFHFVLVVFTYKKSPTVVRQDFIF